MLLAISIICYIFSSYFALAKLTGPWLFKFTAKILAFSGMVLSMIYWCQLLEWI